MAGGKETPRQKMIGMMYLVLTAMLALNVSKDILRAFVAIEENIQKANLVQVDRGNGFIGDVRSELTTSKGDDNKAKREKLNLVLKQMEEIDKETESVIKFIDDLKLEILKVAGEQTSTAKDQDPLTIVWQKGDGVRPMRLNLDAVNAQDKYDEPMLVLGINEDLKTPKGKGAELWKRYNDYRSKIVELTGTYKLGENSFVVKTKPINEFKDNKDLQAKVEKMIDGNKQANLKEDRQALIDLYAMMSKPERVDIKDVKGLHWVGATFDHSPLVAGIASLSSLQQDILSARALALNTWKSRVTTGEYSFNKIAPLAYGQPIANTGDSVYLKVMMAAYDSDNQPAVVITEGADGATIKYPGDGQGIVGFKVGGGAEQIIKGTVAIKNKSGVEKKEPWEYKVTIMKPSGAISLPELNVLYRGYPNKVAAVASGFDQTSLSGAGASVSKSGEFWIASPAGGSKEATLTVSGKNTVTGKSQTLLSQKFRVSNMPNPELYWGAAKNGDKGSRTETKLFAKYGPEIPLNAQFTIVNWEVQIPGAQGAPPKGTGGNLDGTAANLIKQAKPGMLVSFICTVVGPDKIQRKLAGAFKV
jgi:gliding motility-associated protein GldM